jgi:hypothetical protein
MAGRESDFPECETAAPERAFTAKSGRFHVKARYRHTHCATATDAHGDADYPYCEVKIARNRYAFFSKDPIRSIAIATKSMR